MELWDPYADCGPGRLIDLDLISAAYNLHRQLGWVEASLVIVLYCMMCARFARLGASPEHASRAPPPGR